MAAYIPGRGEPVDKDAPLSSRNVSRLTTYELRQELVRRDKLDIPDDQINHRFVLLNLMAQPCRLHHASQHSNTHNPALLP